MKTKRALLLFVGGLCLGSPSVARAQLTVEIVNGYNLVVDSNVTAPSTYAPKAAFIGGRVCNTSASDLSNVFAYVGDYNSTTPSLSTPGVFPSRTFTAGPPADPQTQLYGTGSYSLTIEADQTGTADGTRYIGTLAAGTCRMQYWLFSYPQCVNVAGQPQSPPCDVSIAGDVKPTDDPVLNYNVWATTASGGGSTATTAGAFTLRNEISAAANKIWPNTTAKVPDTYLAAIESVIGWGTLGPDGRPLTPETPVYPGQRLITTQGIWYDLGNVGQGFDNDGDLVPDQNAWLQPVGDPGSFDADCFRMVNVYGIVIVKLKTGGELLIPFQNQLYFEHIPDNTGVVGLVYYQFVATDGVCSANMTPYQEAASGFDNEKFSADYGLSLPVLSRSFGSGLSLSKVDRVSGSLVTQVSVGDQPVYTLSIENLTDNDGNADTGDQTSIPRGADVGVHIGTPDLGMPLVFRETIPTGTTYVAGSAAAGLVLPRTSTTALGYGSYTQGFTDLDGDLDICTIRYQIDNTATSTFYTILYSTNNGASWTTTEPAAASVTSIKWLLTTRVLLDGGHDRTSCVAPNAVYDNGTALTSLPYDTASTDARRASVSFQVTVGSSAGPVMCNTVLLGFGEATSGKQATDCDTVAGNNSLSGRLFEDDGGTTGTYGDGTYQSAGGEVGIGGVTVDLYYDFNGNGRKDTADLFYATTATAAGSDGAYSFTGLPDGPFVVVVSKYNNSAGSGNDVSEILGSRCWPVGTCNDIAGWGNTTYDPNLSLTSEGDSVPTPQPFWPLKLNEDLNVVSLAVNLDYTKNDATARSATNVNFAFAPPLELTKTTPYATVDEGDIFNFSIALRNRLPSVGRQGPTGCEYTVWAPTGTNGTPANKEFNDPANAWNAAGPDRQVATALVTGGGLRELTGTGFNLTEQKGLITKVEAIFFGYFSVPLTDDTLSLTGSYGATAFTPNPYTLTTAFIDSYVGEPPDVDPNSGILWDLTSQRSWSFNDDFSTVSLTINPSKASAADEKTFALDAFGLRVTTDQACEAGPSTTLSPVPLQDEFDTGSFTFVSADPPPTSVSGGTIAWDDVGPILPGTTRVVDVTFRANDVSGLRTGTCTGVPVAPPGTNPPLNSSCNFARTDYGTRNVYYADGRKANDDNDPEPVNIQGKGELRGMVWNDVNNDGWAIDTGETGLPNVGITLFACVDTTSTSGALITSTPNSPCTASGVKGAWRVLGTTTTDATGAYEFLGLDTGYYIVEVGDTDGAPQGTNTSPYGKTQTAEPGGSTALTTQNVTGGPSPGTPFTATAVNGLCGVFGGCNNTWGDPTANLSALNLLNSPNGEEEVTTVDFGYYSAAGAIYGNVWHDIDGDATYPREPGEGTLAGFTVTLAGTSSGTTTTDANGNYSFSGLGAGSYTITITPPTLLNQVWSETHETTGGTGDLNNQIPVSLSAGEISGSHDFGYTLTDTANIGDTLYYDFDGDGFQDCCDALGQPTEGGIPSVTVWLYQDVDRDGTIDEGVDALLATDVTDSSGKYLFEDYPVGSYVVKVDSATLPSEVSATGDPDLNAASIGDLIYLDANADGAPSRTVAGCGTTNGGTNVTSAALFSASDVGSFITGTGIPPGTRITAFVNASNVTISAAATATGTATLTLSDNGIPGVVMRLYSDLDRDGTLDAGEPIVAATVTNVDGQYLFTGLNAGSYFVDIDETTLPSELSLTTTDPQTTVATLASNSAATAVLTKDAGYSPSTHYAIGNRVWHDVDNDGRQDAGEVGIAGVDLTITTTTSRTVVSATTNGSTTVTSAGLFLATDVGSRITGTGIPAGARITAFTNASTITISAAATATGSPTLTVSDACHTSTPCVATTDEYGSWIQTGLVTTRTYTVALDDTDLPRDFTVASGTTDPRTVVIGTADNMGVDFGYYYTGSGSSPTGSISGRIFYDRDNDLTYDDLPVDEAMGGTTVNLLDANNNIVASTTTTATGTYSFAGVFIGDYAVQAVDELGTRYSVVFLSAGSSFPNLNVIYDEDDETTPDHQSSVSIDGVYGDLMQDFGYRRFLGSIGDTVYFDANQNATQDAGEPGFGGVTVRLYRAGWTDTNGDGRIESGETTNETLLSTVTTTSDDAATAADESGKYLFSNLPSLARSVTAVTTSGSTTVTAAAGVFSATDVGNSISGAGIPGGTLITAYDSGTGAVTISANATATGSRTLAVSPFYLVRVVTTTLPGGSPTLTADPDTDGVSCVGYTPAGVCDSAQLVRGFVPGINYLGADFGYVVTAAGAGILGDRLWIDTDADGVQDAGEPGLPYITVWLDTATNPGVLDWTDTNSNGRWDTGEGEYWTQTNSDGFYLFAGLNDGTYNVRVADGHSTTAPDLNAQDDSDWPANLPATPTFEAGTAASFDNSVTVTLTGGVATITGSSCSADCNVAVDFGYRYPGSASLSGTVCIDDASLNGYCGATAQTYSVNWATNEAPLSGMTVALYRWNDDGDNAPWSGATLDTGDTFTLLTTTNTDTNGDYSFSNIPTGRLIVLVSVVDTQNLRLTTTDLNSSTEQPAGTPLATVAFYEGTSTYEGRTVTVLARQALNIGGTTVDVDYAFDGTQAGAFLKDFGDLPDSGAPDYDGTLLASGGAEHRVATGTIRLGSTISTESDGKDSADASLEGTTDDGVVPVGPAAGEITLVTGTAGGSVVVTPSAAGWLAGWIDFNRDGDFADAGEQILNRPVASGAQTLTFDVPFDVNGGVSGTIQLYSRFRIYPSEPLLVAANGAALDSSFQPVAGEVEDYRWQANVTRAVISAFGARETRGGVAIEWRTSAEVGTIGFYLRRWDEKVSQFVAVNEHLLPAVLELQGGRYSYIDAAAVPGVTYQYQLIEVEAARRTNVYGPYTVNSSSARPQRAASLAERVTLSAEAEASGYARLPHPRRVPPRLSRTVGPLGLERLEAAYAQGPPVGARVDVTQSGIYFLDRRVLAAQGSQLTNALLNRGTAVAIAQAPGLSGILFYGQTLDSAYTRDNVYQLRTALQSSPHMRLRQERPPQRPRGDESFTRTVHVEQDLVPATAVYDDPESDYWLWDWVFAGWGTKTFTFRAENVAAQSAEDAIVTVRLKGSSDTLANPDHHAVVRLNGQPVGELSWEGLEMAEAALAVDAALLNEGDNSLEIEGLTDTGAEYSLFYLDSFDVSYPSLYRATNNRIECAAGENASLTITGFTRSDILVFDVTQPRHPVEVRAPITRTADRRYAVTLAPPTPETVYYAVTPDAFLGPTTLEPDWPSRLRSRENAAEYLLITTAELKETAQKLADYRSDLTSLVVDIRDVYDEFGFGLSTPHALRAFLRYAYTRWATPPRYVVLVGDGSMDYKDVWGMGGGLIPPLMVATPSGLFPSDTALADVDGQGPAPEMAIGRLPVWNVEELEAAIQKIQRREATAGEPWQNRMLVVADNPDQAGDFTTDSESLAALAPAGTDVERAYLEQLGSMETRNRLLAGLNAGSGMISYIGHGGYDVLADEGLLWNQDVETLTNAERPTILTTMTCAANHFALLGYPGLGELLARKSEGGAAAVWGPTGLSENAHAVSLAQSYYSNVFSGSEARIGDAITASMRTYETTNRPAFMLSIYVLLGDPALRVR